MSEEVKNGKYKDKYGTVRWYKDGQFHREDGPAVEWNSGTKAWYLNDKLHREDGPAVIIPDGYDQWWLNGQQHREDGPAVEYANGDMEWYLKGIEYTEEQFNQWLAKKELNERLHQTLEEKPSLKKPKI